MKKLILLFTLATGLFAQAVSGTYTGTLKMETPQGTRESPFVVIVKEDAGKVTAALAPASEPPVDATKVEKTGDKLRLELVPPTGTTAIVFDLVFKGDKLAGTVTVAPGIAGTIELTKK